MCCTLARKGSEYKSDCWTLFSFIPAGHFEEGRLGRTIKFGILHFFPFSDPITILSTMFKSTLRILLLITLVNMIARGQELGDENCETLMSEIHITKDEYDEAGRLSRTCSGDVSVTKCEGFCNSQVQPSVVTTTGFLKECYCCRESYLKERIVRLNHCYDADGVRLENEAVATMEIKLREPADCKCYKCGDFSR